MDKLNYLVYRKNEFLIMKSSVEEIIMVFVGDRHKEKGVWLPDGKILAYSIGFLCHNVA